MSGFTQQSLIYQDLSELYGHASANINSMIAGLYDGLVNVILIDEPDVKMDLLDAFRATYDYARNGSVNTLLPAARRLNAYIINSTTYEAIDDFLSGEALLVSQEWAELSARSGYPIDGANIYN